MLSDHLCARSVHGPYTRHILASLTSILPSKVTFAGRHLHLEGPFLPQVLDQYVSSALLIGVVTSRSLCNQLTFTSRGVLDVSSGRLPTAITTSAVFTCPALSPLRKSINIMDPALLSNLKGSRKQGRTVAFPIPLHLAYFLLELSLVRQNT
ncbi:hypothetical protein CC78DRAFT_323873 [Lojkania enalia]|uniref:Uncharacterized protein n=1 Tax=Lojkania enalia TaxID=147567 RepID=A0A9P4K4S6_9PLEO|nr:hypothetical protein CC78DRAFT_323873 [Didymosphaeria enalia]